MLGVGVLRVASLRNPGLGRKLGTSMLFYLSEGDPSLDV